MHVKKSAHEIISVYYEISKKIYIRKYFIIFFFYNIEKNLINYEEFEKKKQNKYKNFFSEKQMNFEHIKFCLHKTIFYENILVR